MDVEDALLFSSQRRLILRKVKTHWKKWCKKTFDSAACATEQVSVAVNPTLLTDAKYAVYI